MVDALFLLTFMIVLIIAVVVGIGFSLSFVKYIVYYLTTILLLLPQPTNFGRIGGATSKFAILWLKGTKSFFFSYYEVMLFFTWLFGVLIAASFSKKNHTLINPMAKWYILFGVLFLGHILNDYYVNGIFLQNFAGSGVINILKQGMFISLLLVCINSEKEINKYVKFIVICLGLRVLWGILRYIFLGGDPTNVYANELNLDVKIPFFDINDSVLSIMLFVYCFWKLVVDKEKGKGKYIYIVFSILAVLVPILSSRRTAQFGLILAMVLLFILLPKQNKWPVVLLFSIVIPLSFLTLAQRSADSSLPIIDKILIDIKFDDAKKTSPSRFDELQIAFKTIKKYPLFGIGPNGSFYVDAAEARLLNYHGNNFKYVHSGFIHVLLKVGIAGLSIFIGLLISFIMLIYNNSSKIRTENKAIFTATLAALVANIPNLFFGTPIIELRTMIVSGFLFALPIILIAYECNQGLTQKNPDVLVSINS